MSQAPAFGEYWVGQGGVYGGVVPGRNGGRSYHIIVGADLGRMPWGPYGQENPATGMHDGLANTNTLLAHSAEYGACRAAKAHTADGHTDFYLPAIHELLEIRTNLGEQSWGWPWSSTADNDYGAFVMDFVDIGQFQLVPKLGEYPVRPVRRIYI